EAYTVVVERALKELTQRDAGDLYLDAGALKEGQLVRVLAAARPKDKLFRRLCMSLAIHGTPACAGALAAFAGDAKQGKRCARWLAIRGPEGRLAARAKLESPPRKGKEAELVKAHLEKVLSLPETPRFLGALLAGSFVQSLDIKTFLVADPPPPKADNVQAP